MALDQEEVKQIANEVVAKVMKSACRCAASFNLIQLLTGTAMDWTRDETMRKWIPDHLIRITNGLNYIEQDCQCSVSEARQSIQEATKELEKKNWEGVKSSLDNTYIHLDRSIVHCAGYITPHF